MGAMPSSSSLRWRARLNIGKHTPLMSGTSTRPRLETCDEAAYQPSSIGLAR